MIATYRIASNYGPGVISFKQLFTPATKWDWRLLLEVLNQSFEWWILMAADDACVADLLDTVHHEMDSVFCSDHGLCGR